MASAEYTTTALAFITSAARAGATQLLDTATRIARSEGISRDQVQQAIAAGRPPEGRA